jgi:hypothetical protein
MANVVPQKGGVEETITRRRIIAEEKAAPPPDFWEYLRNLAPEAWVSSTGGPTHTIYLYREQPAPRLPLGKSTSLMFNEVGCAWNEPEEMELAFLRTFGGGTFRLILKRGGPGGNSEIITNATMVIPGPYKNLTARVAEAAPAYGPPNPNPVYGSNPAPSNGYDPTADVARTAIHTLADKDKATMDVMEKAAGIIKSFNPTAPSNPLMDALMQAAIAKMTADPVETYARMMSLMRETTPAANGGVSGSVTDRLIGAAVDRLLNPPPPAASGPAVGMGAELVRILPNVAQYITQGMSEYARIMEAQRDAIALQRQPGYTVPPPRPMPQPMVLPPQPPQSIGSTDGMQFIESKIIEILREPQSAEWAAEEALSFLDRMDANIVPQLVAGGEQGLMSLFQTRETLKPALQNLPRLQEFIRSFLRFAADSARPEPKPN